jgi:hypothetical protein
LQEKNVRFIAISDNEDSQRGLSDMLMFKSMFNEYFVRDTSRKIRAIKDVQKKNGKRTNGEAPYGYLIDPADKNHLIVDTETAQNVKNIFQMYVDGMKIYDIIRHLQSEKILTPLALKEQRSQRTGYKTTHTNPFTWSSKTLYNLLERQEYLGNMVTNRSHTLSYKSKKRIMHDQNEILIFPNTHEPLIDEHTFEQAQKRLKTRNRANKTGYIDMLSGLLFCGDCNAKMHLHGNRQKENELIFSCGTYKNAKNRMIVECSMHFIRQNVLKDFIRFTEVVE